MIVFLGIGNELRRDDSFGLELLKDLEKILKGKKFKFVSCGTVPFSYLSKLPKSPKALFILDTVINEELSPGSLIIKELKQESELSGFVSSHKLPFSLLFKFVNPERTFLVGFVPKDFGYGTGLSSEACEAKKRAVKEIKIILKSLKCWDESSSCF